MSVFGKIVYHFNQGFGWLQARYDNAIKYLPGPTRVSYSRLLSLSFYSALRFLRFLGRAYFPRTDPGQFVISVKAPTGTRIELSDQYIAKSRGRCPLRRPCRTI